MEHFDEPSPTTLADLLPALAAEGLLPALLAAEALLAEQMAKGRRGEWPVLDIEDLVAHLDGHVNEVADDPRRTDPDTGHPTGAHVAVRGLMVCAKALESRR